MKELSAEYLSRNSHDEHLNVFWQYNGDPHLENNITKAFINTFDSLVLDDKMKILSVCFHLTLSGCDGLSFQYFLQREPDKVSETASVPECGLIDGIPEENRALFAFSPTGKAWGYDGIPESDIENIRSSIKKSFENDSSIDKNDLESKVQSQYEETIRIINNKGDSIPDAWIIIKENGIATHCIAMENKLYDLDPFQLTNHCKKSLHLSKNKIVYCRYIDLINAMSESENYLVGEFIRYLYLLGYFPVTKLSQLKDCSQDLVSKYAGQFCIDTLNYLANTLKAESSDRHRGWMQSVKTNNPFLREIGLCYNSADNSFDLPMYVATTQSSAKNLYSLMQTNKYFPLPNGCRFIQSFHFQYKGTGKNVKGTYCCWDNSGSIESYIDFWVDNCNLIHQSDAEERVILLNKMKESGFISENSFEDVIKLTSAYFKKLNVVPEIGIVYSWKLSEAMIYNDVESFGNAIYEKVISVFHFLNSVYSQA